MDPGAAGRAGDLPVRTRLLYARDVTHETEVDRLKSEFLSTAAHELRTPMVSIFGFAELLQMGDFPAAPRAEMLATIHRQSKAMMAILDELLDLARIEARRGLDFEIRRFDLGAWVRTTVGDFAVPAQRERPQVQAPAGGLAVEADQGKLAQVLRNLLSNAYKYSPGGGPVHVVLRRDGDGVVLEVSDRGIGMTPEQLARACERFYRADASGAIPGSGLGMSIVKEIVELHGGRLQMRSVAGEGTTVAVHLPEATAGESSPEAPARIRRSPPWSPPPDPSDLRARGARTGLRRTLGTMKQALRGTAAALLVIGALDALWLGVVARDFYRTELAGLMAAQVRVLPAAVFYLGYPAGLVALALRPLPPSLGAAVSRSALLGLVAYGVYDMTNLATLQGFGARLALTDMAWGTFVSAGGGAAAWRAMRSALAR